ncbi:glycosyltransferase family 2 protein [Formosa sediminum]|uniref:Glycosyltransferase family 2 protein n=1 Tax=Formosa sediminum TaxID=2594004 RepID=A0A516GQC5_9FLAO|nr:glycosyltransferase family 2 protein [Formosa sediminum]QDO93693.1 glycosyltransferase family 2 protein [Formosa sediminum]
MKAFKVSVIIPLYNASEFLNETIHSVLNQSYTNIEIIIIDDNSTDDSFDKALEYQSDKVFVKSNKGKGACAARNYGFELSSGDYIQFLDADDVLSPDKIEKQVEALNGSRTELAVCNTVHFSGKLEEGKCVDQPYLYSTTKPEEFFINLWGGNTLPMHMVQTSAWLTPRNLINKFGLWNETLAKDQDGEFFARVGLHSSGIIYVPEIKNYYRKHNTGKNIASQKKDIHLKSILKATDLKAKYLFEITESEASKRAIATQYKHVAIDAWPQYKSVYKTAISKCKALGYSNYNPVLGGSIIEFIKHILGWRTAKLIAFYGRTFLNR